ncbi:tetratricopeptide repeat protein [Devosia sp. Leaf64]|uniref:tetratricopeptide repeat protein n=1 Tax=Devosia sp. Leaf64 TaxID=1736229 RepID=UPI000715877D|nr:tetratricopeptide repeat protein [Devosia sp. Leaf64]KQN75016.1 hypothetical protein ASE94_01460 [Devosia sp. Leaf64]
MKYWTWAFFALSVSAIGLAAGLNTTWNAPAVAQTPAAVPQEPAAASTPVDPITTARTGTIPFAIVPPTGAPANAIEAQPATTLAQTAAPVAPQTPVIAQAVPQTAPSGQPDETALRYFAQQGDTQRLQREIERLQALYPNWQPPADPLTTDFVPDQTIVRIWELVTAGDFAGARAAIAEKQQADPGFVPTVDLLETIERGEAGTRFRAASDAGQFEAVISIAANAPQLLTCASVDNLWRLAEAFIKTDAKQRGIDAYSYILNNCTDTAERFATMQKAMALLSRAELDPLLALEKPGTDGTPEFTALRIDLARSAVAAALDENGEKPEESDVELLAKEATTSKNAEDLRLLGYFELARSEPEDARRYFEDAVDADPSAASAEGLGVALMQLDDPAAAEKAMAEFYDDNDTIEGVYRDAAAAMIAIEPRLTIPEDTLSRIVRVALKARDADIAQQLGWYAYAFNQPQTAYEWFQTALGWQSDLEPAAYGMMVAANALGNTAQVEEIRRSWGGRSARIAQFGSVTTTGFNVPLPKPRPQHVTLFPAQVQAVRATTTQARQDYAAAPAQEDAVPSGGGGGSSGGGSCRSFSPPASLSPGGALSHAWCLMDLNRPAQAVDHFGRALDSASQSIRSDAAYGRALAYVRLGLPDEAAVAAAAAPISDKRAIELEISILTLKATSAYGIGDYRLALAMLDARSRYAAERNDLLTLRAWSYYQLKRYREAERIFEAVAATGYGDALAGLEAAQSQLRASQY